jgi:hypothetical protein
MRNRIDGCDTNLMSTALPFDLDLRPEADQQAFFSDVLASARLAEARSGIVQRDILIAGQRIRMIFAGAVLHDMMMPALAHLLAADEAAPDLVLHVWDSASTGIGVPPPPVGRQCFSDRGDIWTFHSERWRSAFHISEYSLNLLDMAVGEGVYWVRDPARLPGWTAAAPFRTLLSWWLTAHDAQLIHGAVVGTADGGVLIVGKGGVGKSTTSLSCLAAGFRFVGDDYVVLAGGERPTAFCLYQTAKLDPAAAEHFPWLKPRAPAHAESTGGEKLIVHIADHAPGQLALSLPLRAVLTPRFGQGGDTRIEPASLSAVLGPAIYTTLAQLPHAGQRTVDLIEGQLQRLACLSLVLGSDVDAVPKAIAALLANPDGFLAGAAPSKGSGPLVSVIIPIFRGLRYLPEAVGSILAQGYPKLEIIVVDDGVTEDIEAVVAALPVEVRLLRKRNGGAADARNTGIRAASGEMIGFLDVDDLWPAGKLELALAYLEANPQAQVVMGEAQVLRQVGPDQPFVFVGSPAESYRFYIGAGVFRRQAFDVNGLFDAGLRLAEDTDWFARARSNALRVDYIESLALNVRRHAENTTLDMSVPDLIPLRIARNALVRKRGLLA